MAKRKNFSNNRFAQIPAPVLNRSLFKRTFGNKFTLDEGYLVPIHTDEIYAGDTINLNLSTFIRLTTPITPVMDNLSLDLHAFFVPSRLVMKDYYKMLGMQENPNDTVNVIVPVMKYDEDDGGFKEGSLADYFGIPTKVAIPDDDLPIALPFRAYNLIYNDWFRDQNLQDSVYTNDTLNDDVIENYNILRRNKKHDYFTSCLPFPQKGEAVNLSLGGQAGLVFPDSILAEDFTKVPSGSNNTITLKSFPANNDTIQWGTATTADIIKINWDNKLKDSYADLSESTAITVNDLREAITIQHILERRARGGTRDVEILQNTYGVSPQDDRLQRPELLSVGRSSLDLSTVAQTSESSSTSPLGDLSAIGTINAKIKVNYSAVENGYLIILASARADVSYQQGLPKMWSKRSFLDVLDPLRARIGEQPVFRKEICLTDDEEYNNEVFGYLPNFDDLRFGRNQITGAFRSNATNSLDIWHFSQEFDLENPPVLGAEFIQQNAPMDRILAVQNNPHFFGDVFVNCNHYRVLPVHGTPGLSRL